MAWSAAEEFRVHGIEGKVTEVEVSLACTTTNVDNIVKRLDRITNILTGLTIALVPVALSCVGFLIYQVFHK